MEKQETCKVRQVYTGFCSVVCADGCKNISYDTLNGLKLQRRIDTLDSQTGLSLWTAPSAVEAIEDFIQSFTAQPENNASTRRKPNSIVALALDLKGLKQINDTYGMDAGDAHITQAACALKLREGDLVFRRQLGGDEFIVLMPWVQEGTNDISLEPFLNRCGITIVRCDNDLDVDITNDGSTKYFSGNIGLIGLDEPTTPGEIIYLGNTLFDSIKEFKDTVYFSVECTSDNLEQSRKLIESIKNTGVVKNAARVGLNSLGLSKRWPYHTYDGNESTAKI